MRTYNLKGDVLQIPAPADLKSDDPVAVGALFGFAHSDALAGEIVAVNVAGVYTRDVAATADVEIGDDVYFDGTILTADDAGGANRAIGYAATVGATDGTTASVKVRLY